MRIPEIEYICERCGKEIEKDEHYPSIVNGLNKSMTIKIDMFRYTRCVHLCGKCKASFVSWWNQKEGAE